MTDNQENEGEMVVVTLRSQAGLLTGPAFAAAAAGDVFAAGLTAPFAAIAAVGLFATAVILTMAAFGAAAVLEVTVVVILPLMAVGTIVVEVAGFVEFAVCLAVRLALVVTVAVTLGSFEGCEVGLGLRSSFFLFMFSTRFSSSPDSREEARRVDVGFMVSSTLEGVRRREGCKLIEERARESWLQEKVTV